MKTLFFIFHGVCHQMSDRALSCDVFSMPLCSRCAGLYTGFFLALGPFLFLAMKKNYSFARAFAVPAIATALVWAADGIANFLTLYDTPNFLRFASGLFFALCLSPVIASLFADSLAQSPPETHRTAMFGAVFFTALALAAANYRPPAALLIAESFASAAGLLMLLVLAHAAILVLIFTRRHLGLAVAVAFVTATAQVAALSMLRNLLGV
mgnify:CR=1 FL=1